MMADLMCQNIGLGEIARCLEATGQLVKERQIDVDLAVSGTIERPRYAAEAKPQAERTWPLNRTRFGSRYCTPSALKTPCQTSSVSASTVATNCFISSSRPGACRSVVWLGAGPPPPPLQNLHRIDAAGFQDKKQHHQHDNAGNTAAFCAAATADRKPQSAATACSQSTAARSAALILDIAALPTAFPAHTLLLPRLLGVTIVPDA